jgi:CYTH domain-containing protein
MIEIERKFLVQNNTFVQASHQNTRIAQGYLSTDPERTVRVRIKGNQGFLTIKGLGNSSGITRFEWEKKIEFFEAQSLLALCEPGLIDKIRYDVKVGKHIFEVDVFLGKNQGLVLAEIELTSEQEVFDKPIWLGAEVTGDVRFYNAYLSKLPFQEWKR